MARVLYNLLLFLFRLALKIRVWGYWSLIYGYCALCTIAALLKLWWNIILRPTTTFQWVIRETPPACLNDTSLGTHCYVRIKVRHTNPLSRERLKWKTIACACMIYMDVKCYNTLLVSQQMGPIFEQIKKCPLVFVSKSAQVVLKEQLLRLTPHHAGFQPLNKNIMALYTKAYLSITLQQTTEVGCSDGKREDYQSYQVKTASTDALLRTDRLSLVALFS